MEIESAYMAGVADSDGSFSLCKRKCLTTRTGYNYTGIFQLTWERNVQTIKTLNLIKRKYGGRIYLLESRHKSNFNPDGTLLIKYHLCSTDDLIMFLKDIIPFLKLKRDQAANLLRSKLLVKRWMKSVDRKRIKPDKLWKRQDEIYRNMFKAKGHKKRRF